MSWSCPGGNWLGWRTGKRSVPRSERQGVQQPLRGSEVPEQGRESKGRARGEGEDGYVKALTLTTPSRHSRRTLGRWPVRPRPWASSFPAGTGRTLLGTKMPLFGGGKLPRFPVSRCTTKCEETARVDFPVGPSCVCSVHNESSHRRGQSLSTNDQLPRAGKRSEEQARRGEAGRWIPVLAS